MQKSSSKECLDNAERLLKDANMLFGNKSFGSALSLSITALEEIGKAIILELTSLNYIDKRIASQAMRQHPPKKTILRAIQKGMILHDQINRDRDDSSINPKRIDELRKMLKSEIDAWEEKRTAGLYVQVNVENDHLDSSPMRIASCEAKKEIDEAQDFLLLGKALCKILPEFGRAERVVHNLRVRFPKRNISNKSRDNDMTISYDEA